MSKSSTKLIYEFIANYKNVTFQQIKSFFPQMKKDDIKRVLYELSINNLISQSFENNSITHKRECRYSHNAFNPEQLKCIYGNDVKTIQKCLAVLTKLKSYYILSFHRLCFYPETIKFGVINDGKESLFEICYVPYNEDNTQLKEIGFLLDKQYDDEYGIKRIVVCDNRWQIENDAETMMKYIPNISSFALITTTNDAIFFPAYTQNSPANDTYSDTESEENNYA